jgi:hypothetical protein
MLGILGIECESGLVKLACDALAQAPQRRTRRRAFGYDFDVDVFRHALDQAVRAAQCGPALEHELKGSLVGGGDRGQRSDDVPILFDQRLVRQFELPPHLDQLLVRRPIGQAPAPGPCP